MKRCLTSRSRLLLCALMAFPVVVFANPAPGPSPTGRGARCSCLPCARMPGVQSPLPVGEGPGMGLCPRPELLSATHLTDSTARLTWADVGDQYEVEVRESGQPFTGSPTHTVSGAPPLTVSGLIPGQRYHFQVRTVCTDTSAWSVPRTFSTALNNDLPCPLLFDLRDTSCASGGQFFDVYVDHAPGDSLGSNVVLHGVRILVEHAWRSDLQIWLRAPDSTRIQLVGGLNAGDKNLGDPAGSPCGQFLELSEQPGAQPLSAAAEHDNVTGYFLPVQAFAALYNGQNPVGVWQLEVCDNKTNDAGKLRLFELVFAPAACPPAPKPAIAGVTESAADLSWDAGTDSLILEYGPAGFVPGSGSTAGTGGTMLVLQEPVSQPFMLNGLNSLTDYRVYLRRRCVPGLWGPNSPAAAFFTNCAYTLLENPDSLSVCPAGCADPCLLPGLWNNVAGDDYEWKIWTGPGLAWPVAGPGSAPEGSGKYFYFRNSCSPTGANGKKAVLRTACLQVNAPATANCHFSFDLYMNTKTGLMSQLALQASLDGGQTWTTLKTWTGNRGKQWRREYVDLNAYDGQVATFQLVATGVFGAYGDIALDNLTFYGSALPGTPQYDFFADSDGDGAGDPDQKITLCAPDAPSGYVDNSDDCDDTDDMIYPGAPEILCNGIDENCNGPADDTFIPAPAGTGNSVCTGEKAILMATGNPVGQFFWYTNAAGGAPLATGKTLTLNNVSQTQTYYLQDSLPAPAGGCVSTRTPVTVTVKPTPQLLTGNPPAICPGKSINLGLYFTDTAGTNGVFTYYFAQPLILANRLSSPFIVPPATNIYYAVSAAASGCRDTASVTVVVHPVSSVHIAQGDSVTVCRGKSLTLNAVASGSAPFLYDWNNGLQFPDIPVMAGPAPNTTATYSVTVTDANGCQSLDFIKVRTLNNVTQTAIQSVQNPGICGGTDGSITLEPLNGTPPYTFTWSGPTSGTLGNIPGVGTITGLKQGGYRVTITDASGGGCSMVLPQIVLNAPGLSVELQTVQHVRCPGDHTGSISLDVSGNNPAIQWSNNETTPSIDSLAAGNYSVTITAGNCVQTLSNIEITAPPPLQIIENDLKNIACFGGLSGSIDLAVFGATPPYGFAWSNHATTEDLANLPAGNYVVTVTDAQNCTFVSDTFPVNQPAELSISPGFVQHVACFGQNTGALSVSIGGGTAPYQIHWNNNAAVPSLQNLAAGNYSATVGDANGCTKTFAVAVTQPALLAADTVLKTDPTCTGTLDGRIEVTMAGGTPPYHFNWSTGQSGAGLKALENQASGVFDVTVTDANDCTLTLTGMALEAPQLLTLTLDELLPADCYGAATGSIAVSVGGNVGSTQVTWNGQPAGLTLADVPAGTYAVRVQDSRGCVIADTFQVTQPEGPLALQKIAQQNVLCAGEPTGSIDLTTSGGTMPYTYLWSNGATGEDLPAAGAGTYTLTVTDANGCTGLFGPTTVSEPAALTVVPTVSDIPCLGPATGEIVLAVTGGLPPYEYSWSTGDSTFGLYFLPAGTYDVTVQDASGCVQVLGGLTIVDRSQAFSLQTIDIQPVSCPSAADGSITVQALNGTAPYQFAWSPPVGLHANVPTATDQATGLAGGTYSVTVTDAAGCTAESGQMTVEEAPPILFNIAMQTNVACKGDSSGAIVTALSGGLPPFNFLWNNGATTQNLAGIPAGAYRLIVTDFLGCTFVSPVVNITQPAAALQIVTDSVRQDRCGNGGGAIFLHVMGGTPGYDLLWNSGQTTATITDLAAGEYQLTVTDAAGCTKESLLFDIEALAEALEIEVNKVDVLCHGGNTGSISVQASGGTPAYQYFWSNGQTGPNLNNLEAGNYVLTLSDAAGCFDFFTVQINDPAMLTFSWDVDSTATGWMITLGVPPDFEVQWSANTGGQTGPVAEGLDAGTYFATVTDVNGCTSVVGPIVVGTVGTAQPEAFVSLQLAPNPATGWSVLTVRLVQPAGLAVAVFNSLGERVLSEKIPERRQEYVLPLELQDLPAGVYFVRVGLEDGAVRLMRLVKAAD